MPEDERDPRRTVVTRISSIPVVATPGSACLVVIYGGELGKRIPIGSLRPMEVGRSIETDIPLEDEAVSRRHARFSWTGAHYVVKDLGSTNGTHVNDASVNEKTLRDGDQVKIGHTIFKFIHGTNIELSYHEEIYRMMTFDGLTQIFNKRSFTEALEREVLRSKRYQRPLSLVLCDIDHFKSINDSRGHLAGDTVLRQFAALVSANVRRQDILARVGGEEFALIIPEVPAETTRTVADKLRVIIERTTFRFEDHVIPVTASFGVAGLTADPGMGPSELYRVADERLYIAKNSGRNRVI